MDLEKLEKLANIVKNDLTGLSLSFSSYPAKRAELKNLVVLASKAFEEHNEFLITVSKELPGFDVTDARNVVNHILAIIEIEKASESKIKELKIFESASEKLKQANLSFRRDDYSSSFHNLNSALEFVLKDKLGIPITITKINTSNIIDILVKHNIEPHLYLSEVRKRVLMIDNKIKHQGYSPSKIDCINGIKAMEELISQLRDKEIKLAKEIRDKILQGL